MREIKPASKVTGRISRTLMAQGEDFVSRDVDGLILNYDGIAGDFHAGMTRNSGGREPWYSRGTEMKNERQVSLLSEEDLAEIAKGMNLDHVDAGWIGANLVVSGIADFSFLPPRTLLIFEGGVTLRVDGYNAPCRLAGGEIARHTGVEADDYTRTDLALAFKDAAHMKRGLVAWVEREGRIEPGETFTARIWAQWIY